MYTMNLSVFVTQTDYCKQGSEIWYAIIKGTLSLKVGQGSSVGMAIRYGLDSLENELRWERYFQHPYKSFLVPAPPPVLRVLGLFTRHKGCKVWRWPSTPHLSRIKKEYSYNSIPPPGRSYLVLWWNYLLVLKWPIFSSDCVGAFYELYRLYAA